MYMKSTNWIVIFVMLSVIASIDCEAEKVKYYRSYSINQWDYSPVPRNLVPESQVNLINRNNLYHRFVYNDQDDLIRIEGYVLGLNFLDRIERVNQIHFEYHDDKIIKTFYDENGNPTKNQRNGVFGEEIVQREEGYDIFSLDSLRNRVSTHQGIYMISNHRDSIRRRLTKSYYDTNQNPIQNELGAYKHVIIFNRQNQILEHRYYNLEDNLIRNSKNFAIRRNQYNQEGNLIKSVFLGPLGRPVIAYPMMYATHERIDGEDKYYNAQGEPVVLYGNVPPNDKVVDSVNYDLILPLTTSELMLNFFSVSTVAEYIFGGLDVEKSEKDSLYSAYYQHWQSKLDSLKKKGLIFNDGHVYYSVHSVTYENPLINELIRLPMDSLAMRLRALFLLADTSSVNIMKRISDPPARFCYGRLKVNEIHFFQWQDILFCVNPYYERFSGSARWQQEKVEIDFGKIQIKEGVKHIFFNGVKIKNYSPLYFLGDINIYFNNCIIHSGMSGSNQIFKLPTDMANNEILFYSNYEASFINCEFDKLNLHMHCGGSRVPYRLYPSYKHHFDECTIDSGYILSGFYYREPVPRYGHNALIFSGCNIQKLEIEGEFTQLGFNKTKVRELQSVNINKIEQSLKFHDSSFESPLNFSNMTMPDTARFEMINTSYQDYMRFPWKEIEGRIHLETEKDRLKAYGNLYNLLSTNYKNFSLIQDADDSYFYWKQFERKNFWKLYWKEKHTHWYNPLHLAKALGLSIFNHVNYYSCGYGVRPLWIFPFTIFIVTLFAFIYFLMPTRISNLEQHLISKDKIAKTLRNMKLKDIKELFKADDFDFKVHKQELIEDILSSIGTDELLDKLQMRPKSKYNFGFFWYCVYFSFSTFTTIGIGDWYPSGKLNKALVMLEGALGWLCLGLFITTYANILLR